MVFPIIVFVIINQLSLGGGEGERRGLIPHLQLRPGIPQDQKQDQGKAEYNCAENLFSAHRTSFSGDLFAEILRRVSKHPNFSPISPPSDGSTLRHNKIGGEERKWGKVRIFGGMRLYFPK
jgi:hypothetical protein